MILAYGDHPEQVGDLVRPDGATRTVVLWHGGGFAREYGREQMAPLARQLNERGYATYNATYRRLDCGGGVPETFDDALAAVDTLDLPEPPMGIGLSAGAPLAVHAAAHGRLARVIDIAGPVLLTDVARIAGSEAGVFKLFGGGPDELPDLYAEYEPGPLPVPCLALHGDEDEVVPLLVSETFAERTGCELAVVPGAGHFDLYGRRGPAPAELFAFLDA